METENDPKTASENVRQRTKRRKPTSAQTLEIIVPNAQHRAHPKEPERENGFY